MAAWSSEVFLQKALSPSLGNELMEAGRLLVYQLSDESKTAWECEEMITPLKISLASHWPQDKVKVKKP